MRCTSSVSVSAGCSAGNISAGRTLRSRYPEGVAHSVRTERFPQTGCRLVTLHGQVQDRDPVRIVQQDSRLEVDGEWPLEPRLTVHEPSGDHFGLDAMRSWLAHGVQLVDRRRRFGSHGRAREMLVSDQTASQNGSERWQALAAALHRHTVRGGLSELGPEHRPLITLAYLQGRPNREIAAMLGVSGPTVRRRLGVARGLLDAHICRTGDWRCELSL